VPPINIQLKMGNMTYSDPFTNEAFSERRSGFDRRNPKSFFAFLTSRNRRRKSKGRRKTDRGAYVDIYDSRTWRIVVAVVVLSFMDALLTCFHMLRGSARELNPILSAIIAYGGLPAFFTFKAAMTILPISVIMIHKEWTLGRYAARLCLWAYILLSFYHLYLITGVQVLYAMRH
jgi:hypothetical protein